jgi:hypothetical protein
MGKCKRLGAGTDDAGLAIEYVRSRKVLRLLGWRSNRPIPPVEIPISELFEGLGIDPRDIVGPLCYLLFAGADRRPAGGLRDLAGTFDCEEKAWAAFRALRQSRPFGQGWAELAAIDGLGHVSRLAWFGLHPAPGPSEERETARRRAVPAARAVSAVRPADVGSYLRAVTPS